MDLFVSLAAQDATVDLVGVKGANLAKMVGAGFLVPCGFMLTVAVYQAHIAANELDRVIAAAIDGLDAANPAALEAASQQIREAFTAGKLAPALRLALAEQYRDMGEPPVAVRSSATAEDLPDMSSAGQHDTFLNVRGVDALCDAVVACWSSLWTARAIGYRERNKVDHASVALAVVVQVMVNASAAGVLFTANPLNGRRTETAINATLGLGETLVSGQVEPDHYVVDVPTRTIVHKALGAKGTVIVGGEGGGTAAQGQESRACQAIPDAVVLELAALGAKVHALYGFPQDIEWAWDGAKVYLLQARPITSLHPLPAGIPGSPLQVWFALATTQGVFEPLTPLGQDSLKLLLSGARHILGLNADFERQTTFVAAADRLYINCTPLLHNRIGRKIVPSLIHAMDPGVAEVFSQLVDDPRLAPSGFISLSTLRRILGFALPAAGRVLRIWRNPQAARRQLTQDMDAALARAEAWATATGDLWADYRHQIDLILAIQSLVPELVAPEIVTAVAAGMAPFFGILKPFAKQMAVAARQPELAQLPLIIARSLPYNVTTEMSLALWQAAQVIRADEAAAKAFVATPAADLAADYLAGQLPPVAQTAVGAFLSQYGMRGPGEIDISRPRWHEQPAPIMHVLQSYLAIDDPACAPDVVFARGIEQAEMAGQKLAAAVQARAGGPVTARLTRWAISRYRALGGLREAPKFFVIRYMGIVRQGLLQTGQKLMDLGMLQAPDDLFYLTVAELQEIGAHHAVSPALQARITERRAKYIRELRRKQLPHVLLSDGTAYYEGVPANGAMIDDADKLVGDPVSPGIVEGIVRVVFSPHGTQLAPGEILVCPGADPAWTPLFLAAGGLIMEVGGLMTHGSVVAREYGIPAVVSVHGATRRLQSGQRVRVDGIKGVITLQRDEGQ